MERRTKKKKNKQSPKDLWDNKHTNMSTGVVPKGQERGKKEKKKKIEEIIAKNFPTLMKYNNLHS